MKATRRRGRGSGGVTGKGFQPGQSGNPGGWPKGLKKYSMLRLYSEALDHEPTKVAMIETVRDSLTSRKGVEERRFAAQLSGEMKPEATLPAVTIIMNSPVNPSRLAQDRGNAAAGAGKWELTVTDELQMVIPFRQRAAPRQEAVLAPWVCAPCREEFLRLLRSGPGDEKGGG